MSGGKEDNQFGGRLRLARELRKLNQAGLAAQAGFPASSIALFEGGARKPSLENLRRLVVALDISADFLLGRTDEPFPASQTDQLYRAFGEMPAEDRALVGDFMHMLAGRRSRRKEAEEQAARERRYRQIEKLAEKLLREEGDMSLPVPVFDLLDRFDAASNGNAMPLLEIELNEMKSAAPNASGALKMHSSIFFIDYGSKGKGEKDQRFAIAHELGHILIDGHVERLLPDPDKDIHYSQANYFSADPFEREADHFASRLLMPEDLLRDRLADLQIPAGLKAIETIAEQCQTPLAAAAIRYAELAEDAVAVIISSGMAVTHCQLSASMKTIEGVRPMHRGVQIPASSKTAQVYSAPARPPGAKYRNEHASLCDWLGGDSKNPTREEAASLGPCGRVLPVLTGCGADKGH